MLGYIERVRRYLCEEASGVLRPDRTVLKRLKELDPALNAYFDPHKCRWVVTRDVRTPMPAWNDEAQSSTIQAMVDIPFAVHTVETPVFKQYKPLDMRTVEHLALACDLLRYHADGGKALDWLVEKARIQRERAEEEARDERLQWYKENERYVKMALENAEKGKLAAEPKPHEPKIYSFPGVS